MGFSAYFSLIFSVALVVAPGSLYLAGRGGGSAVLLRKCNRLTVGGFLPSRWFGFVCWFFKDSGMKKMFVVWKVSLRSGVFRFKLEW